MKAFIIIALTIGFLAQTATAQISLTNVMNVQDDKSTPDDQPRPATLVSVPTPPPKQLSPIDILKIHINDGEDTPHKRPAAPTAASTLTSVSPSDPPTTIPAHPSLIATPVPLKDPRQPVPDDFLERLRYWGGLLTTPDLNGDGVVNSKDRDRLHAAWGTCSRCPEDLNGDLRVDAFDEEIMKMFWGPLVNNGRSGFPDFNNDGIVNVPDLLQMTGNWGPCSGTTKCPWDLNGDGIVEKIDLLILLHAWGPVLNEPPKVTILSPLSQEYDTPDLDLVVLISDPDGLASCWYSLDEWQTNISFNCLAFLVPIHAAEGENTLRVAAVDNGGDINNQESVTFTVVSPPAPTGGETNGNTGGGGGQTACSDGLDNDGDGAVDLDDPGCTGVNDQSELGSVAAAPEDDLPTEGTTGSGEPTEEGGPTGTTPDGDDTTTLSDDESSGGFDVTGLIIDNPAQAIFGVAVLIIIIAAVLIYATTRPTPAPQPTNGQSGNGKGNKKTNGKN